jgi:hypothetical protein
VPIQEGAPAERFKAIWERRGLGWQCEQLARLIDLIVQECKQQDIETATPDEINKMIGLMEAER